MRPLAHVLDQHDDEDRLKGSATIARMMAEDGKSMTARDPKGVGERRQAIAHQPCTLHIDPLQKSEELGSNFMWVYIPSSNDKKEPWVGKIEIEDKSRSYWTYDLVRSVDFEDIYNKEPFGQETVIGLLDHQKRCTLISPINKSVNPGSVGLGYDFYRTCVAGTFRALLSGWAVEDPNLKLFRGIRYSSEALRLWFGHNFAKTTWPNDSSQVPTIKIENPLSQKFEVPNVGNFTYRSNSRVSNNSDVVEIANQSHLYFEFLEEKSLNDVMDYCVALDALFNFLIGAKFKDPSFTLITNNKYQMGDMERWHEASLHIGGLPWKEKNPSHPMDLIHRVNWGNASFETIVHNFFENRNDFMSRIYAVEFSRFFSNELNARFSVTMPTLEQYIKAKFTKGDEENYLDQEKQFWAWVDLSSDQKIIEFAKKHLSVKQKKSPSLPTLIDRAFEKLNLIGFKFPKRLANSINGRRGAVFHSVPDMKMDEIRNYIIENRAITLMIILFTLSDLGIEINYLISDFHALSDFREFLLQPPRPDNNAPPPIAPPRNHMQTEKLTREDWFGPL